MVWLHCPSQPRVQTTPVVLSTLKNRRVKLRLLQLVEVLDDPGELPCQRAVILPRLRFVNCRCKHEVARQSIGYREGVCRYSPSISSTTDGAAGAGDPSLQAGSCEPSSVMSPPGKIQHFTTPPGVGWGPPFLQSARARKTTAHTTTRHAALALAQRRHVSFEAIGRVTRFPMHHAT